MTKKMIMSRTPLRITFTGGGTDIPDYFMNYGPGAVINASINKYIYITVNEKFDNKIRVSYSRTEIVDQVSEINHPVVREALKFLDIKGKIEIVSISDIPSNGTGMGSSSTFTVGLLNALHAFLGEHTSPANLAQEAIKIERDLLKEPGGWQDQYAAAFGGFNLLEFNRGKEVNVEPIIMPDKFAGHLQESLLLLYTNKERMSGTIHADQKSRISSLHENYEIMSEITYKLKDQLNKGNLAEVGRFLNENWIEKRKLSDKISSEYIDTLYDKAFRSGAMGGKLMGSGGGGFLLFLADPKCHGIISKELGLIPTPFKIVHHGSRIVFVGD